MKLKEGLKIQINRLTKQGIKKELCIYIETNEIQYGVIKDLKDRNYYLIHLDSGLSVGEISIENTTLEQATIELKEISRTINKNMLEKGIKRKLSELEKIKGFCYPLN